MIHRLIQVFIPALILFGFGLFFLLMARRVGSELRDKKDLGVVYKEVDGKIILYRVEWKNGRLLHNTRLHHDDALPKP